MRKTLKESPKVLGLDISTKTIGWALFEIQSGNLLESIVPFAFKKSDDVPLDVLNLPVKYAFGFPIFKLIQEPLPINTSFEFVAL